MDLISYKPNYTLNDAASFLSRSLQRSKRFMNMEKRVRFVAELIKKKHFEKSSFLTFPLEHAHFLVDHIVATIQIYQSSGSGPKWRRMTL